MGQKERKFRDVRKRAGSNFPAVLLLLRDHHLIETRLSLPSSHLVLPPASPLRLGKKKELGFTATTHCVCVC